jgi:hypothetical protein
MRLYQGLGMINFPHTEKIISFRLSAWRTMQETNKDKLIHSADNVLFSGIKYKQHVGTNRLFNTVRTREHTASVEHNDIEGRTRRVMLANRLPWLQCKQDRPAVPVDM